ncbi:MAG: NAD(P)/FAD-dependent oxidoreductase [Methanocorpusculum sp.]|nr:NAD(P)/FAD-dependent oxidoreductase [Methanocorpusculum sp.]
MKSEYDVIVIGAGPAGSMAAKTAADAGLSVLLAEKRSEIGVPVRCAEGIIKRDLEEFLSPDPVWISAEIERGILVSPDGKQITVRGKGTIGYTLDRKRFDKALADRAAGAGADVEIRVRAVPLMENGKVTGALIYQGGTECRVKAKLVIAADGVESQFAKRAGINTTLRLHEIGSCCEYLVSGLDIDEKTDVVYFSAKNAPGGYFWVFPKGDHSANIGVGIAGDMLRNGYHAKDALDAFLAEHYPEGKIFSIVTGAVPGAKPLEQMSADNLLIAGDAAHLSDVMTGGGIYQALASGKLAGECAVSAVRAGDTSAKALQVYDSRWKNSSAGRNLMLSYFLRTKYVKLSDDDLNSLFDSLEDITLEECTVKNALTAILKDHPGIFLKLPALLKSVFPGKKSE